MEKAKITVVLADDHPAMRAGIRAILESHDDILVVGEAGDGEGARELIRKTGPDVLLLDLHMSGPRAPETMAWLRERGFGTAVVVLTAYNHDIYLSTMVAAGAAGFVVKEEAPETVVATVRQAARGEPCFTADQNVRARRWQEEVGRTWEELTAREREVLALLAEFRTDAEIAFQLGISEKTAGHHVRHILQKLRKSSRREAGRWALTNNLFTLGPGE